MSIAQAEEMVQQKDCQPLIQQHEPGLDREALDQVAHELQQRISPLVCLESLDPKPWADYPRHQCESIFCEISGVTHLFDDEAGLLVAVNRLLNQQGLIGRAAIADSMGAAWALSHYLDCLPASYPVDLQTGFIAPPGDTSALSALPVEGLRIPVDTVHTLGRLGVESIGQLLRLPRSGLAPRLGMGLVKRIGQALGEYDEPMEVFRAPAEHWAALTLEYPTSDQEILADRIQRLTKEVRAGLATRLRGALRMTCRLDLTAHPPLTLKIGLFAPTIDADHLSGLIINQLESKRLAACVERLTLSVTHTGPLRTAQQSLFDTDTASAQSAMSGSELSRLVDSLSSRLGREFVLAVQFENDPLPEKAYSVRPLAGNSHSFRKSTFIRTPQNLKSSRSIHSNFKSVQSIAFEAHQPSPDDAMRRPLSLLPNPVPLAVARETGSFCRSLSTPQLPSRIRLSGVVHQIVRHWGPERIETGWWKGPCTRRDYYRIETDSGCWWWIFRDLVSKSQDPDARYHWMLHGHF